MFYPVTSYGLAKGAGSCSVAPSLQAVVPAAEFVASFGLCGLGVFSSPCCVSHALFQKVT